MSANPNQFIVTLSPSHDIYLVGTANGFRSVTRIKGEAKRFDSFDEARTESATAIGWPDSRVEDVGPAFTPSRYLDTAALRLMVRDDATSLWMEIDRDSDDLLQMAAALKVGLQDLGYLCAYRCLPNASCFLTLRLTDKDGVTLDLDWDPNIDGFDYETSGDDADEMQRQEEFRLRALNELELREGEGYENDPPEADAEQRDALPDERLSEADDVCDACGEPDPALCSSSGITLCGCCRSNGVTPAEARASIEVCVTHYEIERMLMRDDLTQCQTPLTPAQFRQARAILVYSLRALINAKIAELASGALMEVRDS